MRSCVLISILCVSMAAAGCLVGPDYKRPPTGVPDAFRAQIDTPTAGRSLGDEPWMQVFPDAVLQSLIQTALQQNDDVRLAAARILEAQAQLGITRADQFPQTSAGVDVLGQRPAAALGFPARNIAASAVQGSMSWELDFWGRYRRATEAARAILLASEGGRRAVLTTLVSHVSQ